MSSNRKMNIDKVDYNEMGSPGGKFGARAGMIASQLGARKLGYNVVLLPPGKVSCPYHFHHCNEEMFFIIEGTGLLRYNGEEQPLRAGDVIACPPGSGSAHQITNDADTDLTYLAVSTKEAPEVAQYPDSNKVGFMCGPDPDADPDTPPLRMLVLDDAGVDYWHGEE